MHRASAAEAAKPKSSAHQDGDSIPENRAERVAIGRLTVVRAEEATTGAPAKVQHVESATIFSIWVVHRTISPRR